MHALRGPEEDVEAQRGQGRSALPRLASKQHSGRNPKRWPWSEHAPRHPLMFERGPTSRTGKEKDMANGPQSYSRWPPERILLFSGIVFFPCWIMGGFWRWRDDFEPFADLQKWRCQVMLMMSAVIITGLTIVELVFREV
ncbi:hypothetical protein C2E23DRAFT_904833 [Lenzites betulinus]|nr:hypothetical protein C2E23DRAFT_904833 [Lenzites betulinus]